jgi:choline-sulfatase
MAAEVSKLRFRIAAAALLAAAACRPGEPPTPVPTPTPASTATATSRLNVLFVSIDTIRADHCSVYGYPFETTPRLARLATEGARVVDAYAPMATTGPSHTTMMTSLYPLTHGVVKNGYVLTPEHVTLAERLKARGYSTAAIVSSFPVSRKFGLMQGFDHYDDDFGPRRPGDPQQWNDEKVLSAFDRPASATSGLAAEWIRARPKDRPFFLWVHFFDPHGPYEPPREFRDLVRPAGTPWPRAGLEREIWKYDGEIRFADDGVGKVLDALDAAGLRDSTLVVVVGDHGEGLGDHGRMEHGVMIYEEAVRVPLLFRLPSRIKAGLLIGGPVPLLDLEPTVLDFALGGEKREGLQGESQLPVLASGAKADPDRRIFLQRRLYESREEDLHIAGEKFAVRIGRWKYFLAEQEKTRELYDLSQDPKELDNIVEKHPEKARALDAALAEWRRAQKGAKRQQMSPEDVERLRALGYVQ